MRLPYDLQTLYIRMLGGSILDRKIVRSDDGIKVFFSAPDGRYVTDFDIQHGEVVIMSNMSIGGISNAY